MRIIERGQPEKSWPREWRTPCCSSVLELDPQDIKHNTDYTGGHNSWYINCPVCGAQPDVPDAMKHDGTRWLARQSRIAHDDHER